MLIGALDIGGTKTIVALIDKKNIISQQTITTNVGDYIAHFDRCAELLKKQCEDYDTIPSELYGIGINMPGMVEYRQGKLLYAPFAGWRNVMVKDYFIQKLNNEDVFVDNDVNSCALGEKYFGHGLDLQSYLWITVSTGIGAAIMNEGTLLRGSENLAGELGHVKVEFNAPKKCSCGEIGCLEAYASGSAITRITREQAQTNSYFREQLSLHSLPCTAEGCAWLATNGDPTALSIFEYVAEYLARGISCAVNLLNPSAIILGGGVMRSFGLLKGPINDKMKKYMVSQWSVPPIMQTKLGYEAAVIGLSALVLESKIKH